jgi:hypothetical protein
MEFQTSDGDVTSEATETVQHQLLCNEQCHRQIWKLRLSSNQRLKV